MRTFAHWGLLLGFMFVFVATAQRQAPQYGTITHIDTTMVHDPVIIKQDSLYYIFATGRGIDVYSSDDKVMWRREKPVFADAPQWAVDTIPNFKGHIWAPDIVFFNGQYYLYYSVSAFGKNTSAIGVATNKTLHPGSPDFKWVDHGAVIHSTPNVTNWNAIDAAIAFDSKGQPYMSFGSFWDGIKLAKLSNNGLAIEEDRLALATIATRKRDASYKGNLPSTGNNPPDAGGNAIEAPFIFKKGNYYYLFVSFDYCCKGLESTYKVAVGRSKKITGPYIDKEGIPMNQGGGTVIRQADTKYSGIGHNAVASFSGTDVMVMHGYSIDRKGRPHLVIEELVWEKGWPTVRPSITGSTTH